MVKIFQHFQQLPSYFPTSWTALHVFHPCFILFSISHIEWKNKCWALFIVPTDHWKQKLASDSLKSLFQKLKIFHNAWSAIYKCNSLAQDIIFISSWSYSPFAWTKPTSSYLFNILVHFHLFVLKFSLNFLFYYFHFSLIHSNQIPKTYRCIHSDLSRIFKNIL